MHELLVAFWLLSGQQLHELLSIVIDAQTLQENVCLLAFEQVAKSGGSLLSTCTLV